MEQIDWNERYKEGTIPWDSGVPAPELVQTINRMDLPSKQALEIGCGTGTNSIWLAEHGFTVTATDLSELAIKAARAKTQSTELAVTFEVSDILAKLPVPEASVGLVFDRGVYHVMAPENRSPFVTRVHQALQPGGYWFSICGSADDPSPADLPGPPRMTATEIITPAEPLFQIYELGRTEFEMPDKTKRQAWVVLFRRR